MVDAAPEQPPTNSGVKPCTTPDCVKPAGMQCPTCIKLGLEPTYFCDQECFTKFWKFHKLAHVKKTSDDGSSKFYTGPLRPYSYSFRGHRAVPDETKKPDYAKTGKPNQHFQQLADKAIPVNNAEAIAGIRKACLIGRKALDVGHSMVKVGATTEDID